MTRRIILITGMSGAGKSVALRSLEDQGFEAIDNVPLQLIPALAQSSQSAALAIGSDIRSRGFSAPQFAEAIAALKAEAGVDLMVVFLDCEDEVLRRRYTETRRRHPLAGERPVADGIAQERALVWPLRALADVVIDTSELTSGELREQLGWHCRLGGRKLQIAVVSFSFKKGLPREADMVFDVRFLKNPHYVPELNPLTGEDARVGKYIRTDEGYAPFFERATALIAPLLPRYMDEGKYYLTIAVGCTGGKHRSVFVAGQLAEWLRERAYAPTLRHRDI